jgi:hypothetical protein
VLVGTENLFRSRELALQTLQARLPERKNALA